MEIKTYEAWAPNRVEIQVGDRKMVVKELAAAKRDAVASILGAGLDLAQLFQPLMDAGQRRGQVLKELAGKDIAREDLEKRLEEAVGEDVNIFTILTRLQDKILALLQGDLTLLACVVLDVPENRGKDDKVVPHPAHHFKHSPELFEWIQDNLSVHQEAVMMEAFLEVNQFGELAKKYMALVSQGQQAATGAEATATP